MSDTETPSRKARPPVVLIIDNEEWSTRSLESTLAPNGFAVMRAYNAKEGIERARLHGPDAVFTKGNLADASGCTVCRSLRDDPEIGFTTPIFVTTPERPSRSQRLEAFQAGAWDILSYPIDAEELVLRLDACVQAKLAADRLREEGLMDPSTGLYNLRGLERRAAELSSWAFREREALACVVFSPVQSEFDSGAAVTQVVKDVVSVFRSSGRISDVIGRIGRTEIGVIAPSTNAGGAVQLAERLARIIRESGPVPGGIELRAGYDAVENAHESPSEARALLTRATTALRQSKANGNGWIQPFPG